MFEIGNHYRELPDKSKNKNGYICDNYWTAFVRLKDPIPGLKIDKVVKHCFFKLHESFMLEIIKLRCSLMLLIIIEIYIVVTRKSAYLTRVGDTLICQLKYISKMSYSFHH